MWWHYLEDLANGDAYFNPMPLRNLALPRCRCVHSYVLLVFGALLIEPRTSFQHMFGIFRILIIFCVFKRHDIFYVEKCNIHAAPWTIWNIRLSSNNMQLSGKTIILINMVRPCHSAVGQSSLRWLVLMIQWWKQNVHKLFHHLWMIGLLFPPWKEDVCFTALLRCFHELVQFAPVRSTFALLFVPTCLKCVECIYVCVIIH